LPHVQSFNEYFYWSRLGEDLLCQDIDSAQNLRGCYRYPLGVILLAWENEPSQPVGSVAFRSVEMTDLEGEAPSLD
jgi:hypothetical protein